MDNSRVSQVFSVTMTANWSTKVHRLKVESFRTNSATMVLLRQSSTTGHIGLEYHAGLVPVRCITTVCIYRQHPAGQIFCNAYASLNIYGTVITPMLIPDHSHYCLAHARFSCSPFRGLPCMFCSVLFCCAVRCLMWF